MDLRDLGNKLLTWGLPALGTAIAGPPGGLAAKAAVGLLKSKFGVDEPDKLDELVGMSMESEQGSTELRKLEMDHAVKLRELTLEDARLELEIQRADLADVADARAREIANTQVTGKRDINLYVLSWVVVSGFFGITGIVLVQGLPSTPVMGILIGGLISGFTQVLSYFFGSSRSSKDKTDILAKQNGLPVEWE